MFHRGQLSVRRRKPQWRLYAMQHIRRPCATRVGTESTESTFVASDDDLIEPPNVVYESNLNDTPMVEAATTNHPDEPDKHIHIAML